MNEIISNGTFQIVVLFCITCIGLVACLYTLMKDSERNASHWREEYFKVSDRLIDAVKILQDTTNRNAYLEGVCKRENLTEK